MAKGDGRGRELMNVGDLVEAPPSFAIGLGIIIELHGPWIDRPHQQATVRFSDGTEAELVTTVLKTVRRK